MNVLTPTQQTVLELLADGYTTDEIGRVLNRSSFTVKRHLYDIQKRLGASNRTSSVAEGFRRGLLR